MLIELVVCVLVATSLVESVPGCSSNLDEITVLWTSKPLGAPQTRKGVTKLPEAYKIEIVNQSIPVLCQNSFKNFEHLHELDLSNNGIAELHPGAFSEVPKLSDLHLDGNHLEELKAGVFNTLPITILRLQNNNIKIIGRDTFDDMPRLRVLNLSNNSISLVNSDWFKNTPMIHQLNLDGNLITSLGPHTFKNLHGKQVIYDIPTVLNIDLSDNKISTIDPKAFDGLEYLGMLSLDGNLLETLHEDTFSDLRSITSLSLMHNKIVCLPIHIHHILKADVTYLENNPWNCTCVNTISRQARTRRLNVHVNYEVLKCKIDALSAIVRDTLDGVEYDDRKE